MYVFLNLDSYQTQVHDLGLNRILEIQEMDDNMNFKACIKNLKYQTFESLFIIKFRDLQNIELDWTKIFIKPTHQIRFKDRSEIYIGFRVRSIYEKIPFKAINKVSRLEGLRMFLNDLCELKDQNIFLDFSEFKDSCLDMFVIDPILNRIQIFYPYQIHKTSENITKIDQGLINFLKDYIQSQNKMTSFDLRKIIDLFMEYQDLIEFNIFKGFIKDLEQIKKNILDHEKEYLCYCLGPSSSNLGQSIKYKKKKLRILDPKDNKYFEYDLVNPIKHGMYSCQTASHELRLYCLHVLDLNQKHIDLDFWEDINKMAYKFKKFFRKTKVKEMTFNGHFYRVLIQEKLKDLDLESMMHNDLRLEIKRLLIQVKILIEQGYQVSNGSIKLTRSNHFCLDPGQGLQKRECLESNLILNQGILQKILDLIWTLNKFQRILPWENIQNLKNLLDRNDSNLITLFMKYFE